MMTQVRCFSCGAQNTLPGPVGLREECSQCGADLHCCRCCIHHDVKVYNECKETQAEVVREKDRANFCDHYSPNLKGGSAGPNPSDLRAAAEALFKKKI